MRADARRVEKLVMQVQKNFLTMPSLRVTLSEAQRRFRLDRRSCEAILAALVDARVLTRAKDGAYTRLFPRVAKAA